MTKQIHPKIKHADISDLGTILSIYMENSGHLTASEKETGILSPLNQSRKTKRAHMLNDAILLQGTEFRLAGDAGYLAFHQSENKAEITQLYGTPNAKRLLVNHVMCEARESKKITALSIYQPHESDIAMLADFGFKPFDASSSLSLDILTL